MPLLLEHDERRADKHHSTRWNLHTWVLRDGDECLIFDGPDPAEALRCLVDAYIDSERFPT